MKYLTATLLFGFVILLSIGFVSAYSSTYTGLPENFSPDAGYRSVFGVVGLWDGDDYFIAQDGINFQELDLPSLSDFEPNTGYSHPFQDGLVGLWDEGDYRVWQGSGSFFNVDLGAISTVVPQGFEAVAGYWHGFGPGIVSLWDDNGDNYVFVPGQGFMLFDEVEKTGLLKDRAPVVGYYYDFDDAPFCERTLNGDVDNNGVVDLIDLQIVVDSVLGSYEDTRCSDVDENGEVTDDDVVLVRDIILEKPLNFNESPVGVQVWYSNGKVFETINGVNFEEVELFGLPSGAPDVGYSDFERKVIVLWFGDRAFESDDGRNFEEVNIEVEDDNGDDGDDDSDDDDGDDDDSDDDTDDDGDDDGDDGDDQDDDSDDDDQRDLIRASGNGHDIISDGLTKTEYCALTGYCPEDEIVIGTAEEAGEEIVDGKSNLWIWVIVLMILIVVAIVLIIIALVVKR